MARSPGPVRSALRRAAVPGRARPAPPRAGLASAAPASPRPVLRPAAPAPPPSRARPRPLGPPRAGPASATPASLPPLGLTPASLPRRFPAPGRARRARPVPRLNRPPRARLGRAVPAPAWWPAVSSPRPCLARRGPRRPRSPVLACPGVLARSPLRALLAS
jgi:hypothetical protein